ncbi:ABC transporter ATP-binding protein [Sneathiella chinensis]|uniref:ABC transporter ATP-binding protein n=1 Tax=Sneathiella chinensis TaxID=349750 RepID=A0ABQ5U5U0_9PROT|nr:ABC transporter ATP-binding protein [Sneathiella chinensis]GLQ06756.1 ABC transporter ATP-binding protein [Sneathiella chinensis]
MLSLSDLSLSYGKHLALDKVSFQLAEGETVVILGANGAGKSSLLKALAGLERYSDAARITFVGDDIAKMPAHKRVDLGLSLVPEGRGLFPALSVEDNLLLGANTRNGRPREKENRDYVLDLFPKLRVRARQLVGTMSGGEQQMVAIARALMSAPKLLMLDEPSLGLAPIVVGELFETLKSIRASGVSMLIVEQNVQASLGIADRGYIMETGRIIGEGRAEDLLSDPNLQEAYLGTSA